MIYQVYPRSFFDSNGDGVGDLPGVLHKLDYIASLNVDAIWLSPFFTSPMKDFGYDVADYRGVDPLFGTLDDFVRLVEACHERGMRVLIDQVLNHSSDQHPGSWRAAPAAPTTRPTGTSGPTPSRMAPCRTTGSRFRRPRVELGQPAPAVLPAQFPIQPAGPEFPLPGRAGSVAR